MQSVDQSGIAWLRGLEGQKLKSVGGEGKAEVGLDWIGLDGRLRGLGKSEDSPFFFFVILLFCDG